MQAPAAVPDDDDRRTLELEAAIQGYLDEIAEAGTADLDRWAARVARGTDRSRFRREASAEEYSFRLGAGREVDLDAYLARFGDQDERRQFLELVRAHSIAARALPSDYVPGGLIGGQFRIREMLGRGGMSVVYSAFDTELECEVAIKVFNTLAAAGNASEWEETARSEAVALANLDSPNIVRVYRVFRNGQHTFIVMDRVRGADLWTVLGALAKQEEQGAPARTRPARLRALLELHRAGAPDEERLPDRIVERSWPRTVAKILQPVADAIELAHQHHRVHRDLKPNNVLLRPGGDPVVLDFGLSTQLREHDDSTHLRGTPEYFAPEQARSRRTGSDVRTDVYQLGLILFEMLTLERGHEREKNENVVDLLDRVANGMSRRVAALPASIPLSLRAICARALEPDPEKRYASAGEMAEDLGRFLARLPNRHATTSAGHALAMRAKWAVREPVLVGALLLAIAGGVGWWARVQARNRWTPPVITLFHHSVKIDPATRQNLSRFEPLPVVGSDIKVQLVSESDTLGAVVDGGSPSHIYAIALSGDGTPHGTVVRPMQPCVLGEPNPKGDGHDGMQISEGRWQLACSHPDGRDAHEGLLVFATKEPHEGLEDWIGELNAYAAENGGTCMDMGRAMRGLDTVLAGGRGARRNSELRPEERQSIVESVSRLNGAAQIGTSRDQRLKYFQQIFEVEAPRKE